MAENNQVGEKIRKVRKCLGFSQEEFAFRVGVTKQTVSSWELGSAQPGFDKINFICQEFSVDANTFIYPIDKKNSDRKVAATTITNDVIFLHTPTVAETKSEDKQFDKKKRKIVFTIILSSWLIIALLMLISLIGSAVDKSFSEVASIAIAIKTLDIIILFVILIGANLFFTGITLFVYKKKLNKTNKEIKNS